MPTHRIAPRHPPNRHHTAANDPVLRDRLARILRATRLEPARRPVQRMNHRRHRRTINRNRADQRQIAAPPSIVPLYPQSPLAAPRDSSAQIARRHRELIADSRRRQRTRAATRDHDDRSSGRQMRPDLFSKNLAHPPLHPVAHHRISDSARDRDAQPRSRRLVHRDCPHRARNEGSGIARRFAGGAKIPRFDAACPPRRSSIARAPAASPAAWAGSRLPGARGPSHGGA